MTLRARAVVIAAAAATAVSGVALVGTVGAVAHADTATPVWTGTTAIPNATTDLTGDFLSSGPTGQTLLVANRPDPVVSAVTPGALGTPGFAGYGLASGKAAYLPNGDAVIYTIGSGEVSPRLTYRFADGHVGGSVSVEPSSFAVNSGELLVVTASGPGLQAQSYAISNGQFTANGSKVTIYSGDLLFGQSSAALDADGTAEILTGADGNVTEIRRLNQAGVAQWQTPTTVVSGVDTNAFQAVSSPGGRMVAVWTDYVSTAGYDNEPDTYAAIREPGKGLGAAVTLSSQAVPNGGTSSDLGIHVAAGPDGTLAVTDQPQLCPDHGDRTTYISEVDLWVAKPGAGLGKELVADTTSSRTHIATVTALGAGGGRAVVGVRGTDVTSTDDPQWTQAPCGSETYPGTLNLSFTDEAYVSGVGAHAFGHGSAVQGSSGSSSVSYVTVTSASVDPNGAATVIGSLSAPNQAEFATFGGVGGVVVTPTPTASATPSASATPTPSASAAPLPQAGVRLTTSNTVSNGTQSVTVSNTGNTLEDVYFTEIAQASGLVSHAVDGKPKTVVIASKHVQVKPHKSLKVTLKLSAKAKKTLASHKLKATLTVRTTAKGHSAKTVTKSLTLKAK